MSLFTPIKKRKEKDQGIKTSKYASINASAAQKRITPQRASKNTVFIVTPFK